MALDWFLKAIEMDPEDKSFYAKCIGIFNAQGWEDDKILAKIQSYPKI